MSDWTLRVPGPDETSFWPSKLQCPGNVVYAQDTEGRYWQLTLPPLPNSCNPAITSEKPDDGSNIAMPLGFIRR